MEVVQDAVPVSVEIYNTDNPSKSIVIGGEPKRAIRFARRLARAFDMPTPADDELLKLYITAAEFDDQLTPLLERFPDLLWTWMDVAHQYRPEQELQHCPVILSPRLRERYPGENSEQVSPLMEPLV